MGSKLQLPQSAIADRIYILRGVRVMLDVDLGKLYVRETKHINQAVKRNPDRFPIDFAFPLKVKDMIDLKSQIVTSSSWGGRRKPITAFTEHGILMLSSVLNSERAVQVNIHIMRTFVRLNRLLSTEKDIARKLDRMEGKVTKHDTAIRLLVKKVQRLGTEKAQPRKRLGYLGGDNV